jgi:hypothetical protein
MSMENVLVVKHHGRQQRRSTGGEFVFRRSRWHLPSVAPLFVKSKKGAGLPGMCLYNLGPNCFKVSDNSLICLSAIGIYRVFVICMNGNVKVL